MLATVIEAGPYEPQWGSLTTHPVPSWFQRDRMGVSAHWGPYAVPGWTPRGTEKSPLGLLPRGRLTHKPASRTLYYHLYEWPEDGRAELGGIESVVVSARLLATGEAVTVSRLQPGTVLLQVPGQAPDPHVSVIAIEYEGPLEVRERDTFPVLSGPYLGQDPPGSTPEVFAPGVISTKGDVEFSSTFSPDGREFFFTRRAPGEANRVFRTRLSDGTWTRPMPAGFAGDYWGNEPSVTPDGRKLFFGSKRPREGEGPAEDAASIWLTEKVADEWAEPTFFGSGMMYVSATRTGTLYYTDKSGGSADECFLARKTRSGEGYSPQERLPEPLDALGYAHPFIAPDESYIIFDQLGGLYVSFRDESGRWTSPANLSQQIGPTAVDGCCPYVSYDGQYLFYSRFDQDPSDGEWRADIYWVSADVIGSLRPDRLR